jgi:hypothetical protein
MTYATDGQLPRDTNGAPAEGVYSPNTGTVAQQAGTVTIDSGGQPSAPTLAQICDGATPTRTVTAKAANAPPTLGDQPLAVAIAPANTGLPVNTPVIVQKAVAKSTGSVASLAAPAFTNANVAGNSIVVVCGIGNGTDPTIADTAGNTYTKANTAANSTTFEASIWFATNIIAGANTVTVTNAGAAASMVVEVYEVSGLIQQVNQQPDQTQTNTGTSGTASTAVISPAFPNEIAFSGIAVGTAAQTITPASGWTNDSGQQNPVTPAGLFSFVSMSQFVGSLQSVTPKATFTSEPWAIVAATFMPVVIGVRGSVTIGGYNKTNITSGTTTLVKTGAGVLHSVAINKLIASATIELDDALTNTNSFGIITLPGTITALAPFSIIYDAAFATGLSITTSGATDVTVTWK